MMEKNSEKIFALFFCVDCLPAKIIILRYWKKEGIRNFFLARLFLHHVIYITVPYLESMSTSYKETPLLSVFPEETGVTEINIPFQSGGVFEGQTGSYYNVGGGYSFRYEFSDQNLVTRNRFIIW